MLMVGAVGRLIEQLLRVFVIGARFKPETSRFADQIS